MSGLFGGSPTPPTPPPAPSIDDAEAAGQQTADELRRRRGMASTILAGANSGSNQPTTQAAALLGADVSGLFGSNAHLDLLTGVPFGSKAAKAPFEAMQSSPTQSSAPAAAPGVDPRLRRTIPYGDASTLTQPSASPAAALLGS